MNWLQLLFLLVCILLQLLTLASGGPTIAPTTFSPTTAAPTTTDPTIAPTTTSPTMAPSTKSPTFAPTAAPTTRSPSAAPSNSKRPTRAPFIPPTSRPTSQPSSAPSATPKPSPMPTSRPSSHPSGQPSTIPLSRPSSQPSRQPSSQPTVMPSSPTSQPTGAPSIQSRKPTPVPTRLSRRPTVFKSPTSQPSSIPSSQPRGDPTSRPSSQPTSQPSIPTSQPSRQPTGQPSRQPIVVPSASPTAAPTSPTSKPTTQPSAQPYTEPSSYPTARPTSHPSSVPSKKPTPRPSVSLRPSVLPTSQPSSDPSAQPTQRPSGPTSRPTSVPLASPSRKPTPRPTAVPTLGPTVTPTSPTLGPTMIPTAAPQFPTVGPTQTPVFSPTSQPSRQPSSQPSRQPFGHPTSRPSSQPSFSPTQDPSSVPSAAPSVPTSIPSSFPSSRPTGGPTPIPTLTYRPTPAPTSQPSSTPSSQPSHRPSSNPTKFFNPTPLPTSRPTSTPTSRPTTEGQEGTGATFFPTASYQTFSVSGSAEFDPDSADPCSPVELTIYIQFSKNVDALSDFRITAPGITTGDCYTYLRGQDVPDLYISNTEDFKGDYLEGTPIDNFGTSMFRFTTIKAMTANTQYTIVLDRMNAFRRSCSSNNTWSVELRPRDRSGGYVGSIDPIDTFSRKCFMYYAALNFTSQIPHFTTGLNLSLNFAFQFTKDTHVTIQMPGFTNKIANFGMNPITSGEVNVIGNGNNQQLVGLSWNTEFSWLGYWVEGDYTDYYKDSKIILVAKGYRPFNQRFWLNIPKDLNHITPVCGHPANSSAFLISANSTYFYSPPTAPTYSTLIGAACDALNGCSKHGQCDFCLGKCVCDDGYGSEQDKKFAAADTFPPDCSGRSCPVGRASGFLQINYNFSKDGDAMSTNMHPLVECSNNGICDRATGTCKCRDGYRGGACERAYCPGKPACSGRGRCLSMQRLAGNPSALPLSFDIIQYSDSNLTSFKQWDTNFGHTCLCDSSWAVGLGAGQVQQSEFFGPSCEFRRCPSGDDPSTPNVDETDCKGKAMTGGEDVGQTGNKCHVDCSNRGKCDYNSGICSCFPGYYGLNCGLKKA